jgi:hypothetical protein
MRALDEPPPVEDLCHRRHESDEHRDHVGRQPRGARRPRCRADRGPGSSSRVLRPGVPVTIQLRDRVDHHSVNLSFYGKVQVHRVLISAASEERARSLRAAET